ncbi:MAG: FeoA family protein [bacterium]|nr:FeoA family protein [bacterium]
MMRPLSTLHPGETARLGQIPAMDIGLARELAAMRLLPGEVVTVLASVGCGGPLLVQGTGGVFALGRSLAARLAVESLVPCP